MFNSCNPMDCSLPGSSVHRIFQARMVEWVAISYSRGSSRPRDQACISCTGRQILYHCATWEVLSAVGTCTYDGTVTDWWLGYVTRHSWLWEREIILKGLSQIIPQKALVLKKEIQDVGICISIVETLHC